MNDLFEKVVGDEYFQEIGLENIKDASIKSFMSYSKNTNINDLKLITLDDVTALFTYNNHFIFYNIESDIWGTILHEVLNTNTNSQYAKLIDNSDANVEYILYPFENDTDLIVSVCPEYLTDMSGSIELECTEMSLCENMYILENGYKLYISNTDDGWTYIIKKEDTFVSGFIDYECNFQLGDCITQTYMLKNGNIIVYNYGDVPSAVIIRFKQT